MPSHTHLPKPTGIKGRARRVSIDVTGPPDQRTKYNRAKSRAREREDARRRLQRVERPLMVVKGKQGDKLKVTIRHRLAFTVKPVLKVVKQTHTTITIVRVFEVVKTPSTVKRKLIFEPDAKRELIFEPDAKRELFPTPTAK